MSVALTAVANPPARDGRPSHSSTAWATYWRIASLDFTALIILSLLLILAYVSPIYYSDSRLIPVPHPGSNISESIHDFRLLQKLSYPLVKEPISTFWCATVVVVAPLFTIAIFQLRLRSLWDFHAGLMGLLRALGATTLVCTILKHSIGGFRPNSIDACKPDFGMAMIDSRQQAWISPAQCTGDSYYVKRGLEGFPSGHAANSFAAAIFITLYINAKFKVFADYEPGVCKFVVLTVPFIWASVIAGSMYTTHQHHAHEIFCGLLIGLSIGTLAYRSVYAAVFNFRFNHIPLPPSAIRTKFLYTAKPHTSALVNKSKRATRLGGDHLVVPRWWGIHRTAEVDEKRESIWLSSIGSVNISGDGLGSLLRRASRSVREVETRRPSSEISADHKCLNHGGDRLD